MYKTYDQIVAEMQADMEASGSQATDWNDGSQIQTMVQVTSRALYTQWYMLEFLVELFFVSSCEGPFLDLRVNERGIYRNEGTASAGPIEFSRTSPSPIGSDIPAGSIFASMDGTLQFETTEDCSLPSGWTTGTVNVNCTTVGAAGNLVAGTPLQIVGPTPSGLQTITVGTGGLTGGVDTESDDALRARYLFAIQNPTDGGTPGDYLVWADAVNGVTNASVFPLARGNGTVDVVVSDGGIPSADFIAQVQAAIDAKVPIGADARVLAPTSHPIDATITITIDAGYTFDAVQPVALQAFTNYLSSLPNGGIYRVMAASDAVFKVPGVIDCSISGSNVQLGNEEMATPGNVNVAQGS
ncbi:baseplate J/gp47 family protein [Alicyclobacillus fastidiosus]|uniref:Baseplate J/gp47 family protein n=1 Tax=Alicyclobacillus fastidiosus TaxID=392011 RepID=A0ABV5AKN1_9BACL|nr:baseplate J/gp47 family protein [Alicyclobacillus fastidiosus]WEH08177.1 baseplate J/gp47 family protein [Alicyclobacillus fastidiosus]